MKSAAHNTQRGTAHNDDLEPITVRVPSWVVRELELCVQSRTKSEPGIRYRRSDEVRTILIDHFSKSTRK